MYAISCPHCRRGAADLVGFRCLDRLGTDLLRGEMEASGGGSLLCRDRPERGTPGWLFAGRGAAVLSGSDSTPPSACHLGRLCRPPGIHPLDDSGPVPVCPLLKETERDHWNEAVVAPSTKVYANMFIHFDRLGQRSKDKRCSMAMKVPEIWQTDRDRPNGPLHLDRGPRPVSDWRWVAELYRFVTDLIC